MFFLRNDTEQACIKNVHALKDNLAAKHQLLPREFPDARPLPINFRSPTATGINRRGKAKCQGPEVLMSGRSSGSLNLQADSTQ